MAFITRNANAICIAMIVMTVIGLNVHKAIYFG